MPDTIEHINGTPVLLCSPEGPTLRDERDATDLIGHAFYQGASWVAIPTARLTDDFFRLRTRVAGDIIQKFVNYGVGLAVIGDITHHAAAGTALTAFIHESNRGTHLWFLSDLAALRIRLTAT